MHNFHFTLLLKKIPKIKELVLNFYMWGITFYPLKKISSSKFRVYMLSNLISRKDSLVTSLIVSCGIHNTFRTWWKAKLTDAFDILRVIFWFHILLVTRLKVLILVYLY